jgi:hypothetical protein
MLAICTIAIASTASSTHAFQPLPSRIIIGPTVRGGRDRPNNPMNPPPRLLPRPHAAEMDVDDVAPSLFPPLSPMATTSFSLPFVLSDEEIDFQSLLVMDVVLFQRRVTNDDESCSSNNNNNNLLLELGAVQENGNVAPLSTWTLDSAFTTSNNNEMMQFVVDDKDIFPGLSTQEVQVWKVLDGSVISYGSRQVGGGKGPGNPHGEESELIYYIDRNVVERKYARKIETRSTELSLSVVVNSKLEHLW